MFFKKLRVTFLLFLLTILLFPTFIKAYSEYVIVGGENIGIELNSHGVMVVGFYEVNGTNPANNAGLKVGDIILSVNSETVQKISELQAIINRSNSDTVILKYKRDNEIKTTSLKLVKDNNTYKTGIYVKDSITGIGTLTFIDPNTKLFGALGHEIIEKSTGKILNIRTGSIFESSVSSINRSEVGSPGEKNARFFNEKSLGTISENTNKGIFGTYSGNINSTNLYKVATANEVKIGDAKILTVTNGSNVEEYNIKITKIINNGQKTKNIMFEITDKTLIEKTGGIVQGMSGSPIIQGKYIVGAVTHVVIDNPERGYGIFITNMLEEAEN